MAEKMNAAAPSYRTIKPTVMLAPVPAVLVSCGGARPNALTVAWTGTVCSHPPMVSISIRPERYSYGIIRETGEFVINLTDRAHARAADYCGVRSGRNEDKLAACGLITMPMPELAHAPALVGFPVSMGCKITQTLPLGSHTLFLAEIVSVLVREDLFDAKGGLNLSCADLICYNHGVYQGVQDILGFFGWSVARKTVYERRMLTLRGEG